jgi:uncharacterized protein YktB (UPF0637 family)
MMLRSEANFAPQTLKEDHLLPFPTFTSEDFDVFKIGGLEPRMKALIALVRPKLTAMGQTVSPYLSALCGEEMFPHVARHARRTINPPNDTWVAWANNKKGYKAHPHFQVGLWSTHLFIQFAIIYESNNKAIFAEHFTEQLMEIRAMIPGSFFWSLDHMQPEVTLHREMNDETFGQLIHKLKHIKKAEALCGIEIKRDDPILLDPNALEAKIESTFRQVMPLYKIAF